MIKKVLKLIIPPLEIPFELAFFIVVLWCLALLMFK